MLFASAVQRLMHAKSDEVSTLTKFKLRQIVSREPCWMRARLAMRWIGIGGYRANPSIWVPTTWKRRGRDIKPRWQAL